MQYAKKLLIECVPELEEAAICSMADTILLISIRMMASYMPAVLTEEKIDELDEAFRKIPIIG